MTTSIEQTSVIPEDVDPFVGACPPWCGEAGGAHEITRCAVDRTHQGLYKEILLELGDGQFDGFGKPPAMPFLEFEVQQNYREVEARIWIGKSGDNIGFMLTPAELSRLVEHAHIVLATIDRQVCR